MHQDPEQMALLGGVRTSAQTEEYMCKNLAHWDRYGFGTWVLSELASGLVAGRALLRHVTVAEADEVEVGYSLYPHYWGKGLATEITRACLTHARDKLSFASVVALTLPVNQRSQRVMTKAGMLFERDVLHDGQQHVLFRATLR
jgi:RimJ/RimL family protein N-acetyltransferase